MQLRFLHIETHTLISWISWVTLQSQTLALGEVDAQMFPCRQSMIDMGPHQSSLQFFAMSKLCSNVL